MARRLACCPADGHISESKKERRDGACISAYKTIQPQSLNTPQYPERSQTLNHSSRFVNTKDQIFQVYDFECAKEKKCHPFHYYSALHYSTPFH